MNKPNPNRCLALWHLDCATNLNPQFTEAIDLKQQITGKLVTDVDNSAIRRFVREQIMLDVQNATTQPPSSQPSSPPPYPPAAPTSASTTTTKPSVAGGNTRPSEASTSAGE
jgi:hypothetical protein